MSAGFSYAIACAVSWTLANVTIQTASRRFGAYTALVGALLGGTVLLALLAIAFAGAPSLPRGGAWLAILGAGVSAAVAYGGLFVAMGQGRLSVAAPIISGWSVISLAIGILVRGENLEIGNAVGVALVIGGNLLLATGVLTGGFRVLEARTVVASVVSALGFGLLAPLTDVAVDSMGRFWPPPMIWGVAALVGLPILLATGRLEKPPQRLSELGVFLLPAICEAAGFLSLVMAMRAAPLAIVAPVCSLSTGFSVLIGIAWLREPLRRRSLAGAVCTSLGVVLVNV